MLLQGHRPKAVSKQLGIDVAQCYRIKQRAKSPAAAAQPRTRGRRAAPECPKLSAAIAQYLAGSRPGQFQVAALRRHLAGLPGLQVPSYTKLRGLIATRFRLQYARPPLTNSLYDDPRFDPERIWAARTLAGCVAGGCCVVSVDESCFRLLRQKRRWLPRGGPLPEVAADYASRAHGGRPATWSLNLLGAMTLDAVVGLWVVEGTTNHTVFGFFLEQVVQALRSDQRTAGRRIVLHIDNARPHHVKEMLSAVTALGVDVLFNARYSPQLASIEMLWGELKRRLRREDITEKRLFVERLLAEVESISSTPGSTRGLWRYAFSNWSAHIQKALAAQATE